VTPVRGTASNAAQASCTIFDGIISYPPLCLMSLLPLRATAGFVPACLGQPYSSYQSGRNWKTPPSGSRPWNAIPLISLAAVRWSPGLRAGSAWPWRAGLRSRSHRPAQRRETPRGSEARRGDPGRQRLAFDVTIMPLRGRPWTARRPASDHRHPRQQRGRAVPRAAPGRSGRGMGPASANQPVESFQWAGLRART
jgi:hypothetical protein